MVRYWEKNYMEKIRLGISACLLGEKVRYDGGHKLDRFLVETLGKFVEYVPVCPEAESGLGIPREAMRLEGDPESPRLVTIHTKKDMTDWMVRWAKKRVAELEKEDLFGFIFKSRSPSSGMARVKVYNENGMPVNRGVGIFAKIFMDHFPLLPAEDEGRLQDPEIRENFIDRVFTFKRWRDALALKKSRGTLVDFHSKHKLLILSHSPKHYQQMGKLIARIKEIPIGEMVRQYQTLLMEALELKSTAGKNANVLEHMMGYFKDRLSPDEKQELLETIGQYRHGLLPLIVPITLINHYVRKYDQAYLKDQVYLSPSPMELRLRNHV
jgi:uncharacterized protein YbgA (DUF1722 family)/uncharacterized protein YbbK (DUF523 family)